MKEFNIVVAGVGGQGILLAAEILGTAALKEELNVRVSEIHGMAQRGGSVISNIRIGENVLAPTILEGSADVLLGFEPLETVRNLKFTSKNTLILMNDEPVSPSGLTTKMMSYASLDEITEKINGFTRNVVIMKAAELAKEAGSVLTRNAVLIGGLAATGKMPVKIESLKQAIRELVPTRYLEMNMKAFELGYEDVQKKLESMFFSR
jgi:indolepyruvate ferredoxin oxidoreductase beta subunit